MGKCSFGELFSCPKQADHLVVRTDQGPKLQRVFGPVGRDNPADYCLDHAMLILEKERHHHARMEAWKRWRSLIKDI